MIETLLIMHVNYFAKSYYGNYYYYRILYRDVVV